MVAVMAKEAENMGNKGQREMWATMLMVVGELNC